MVFTTIGTYIYLVDSHAIFRSMYIQLYMCFVHMQWNGKECNKDERAKAAEFMLSIKVCVL